MRPPAKKPDRLARLSSRSVRGAHASTEPIAPSRPSFVSRSARADDVHFTGAPPREDAVVTADQEPPVVVDSGGDTLVARVVADAATAKRIGLFEASAKQAEAARHYDVHIAVERVEHRREDRGAFRRRGRRVL